MGKSITISLTKDNYYRPTQPFGEVGMLLRIAGEKRLRLKCTDINCTEPDSHTLTLIKGYSPSPKSTLKHRTIFSKIKGRIF